ncbi:MAG: D-amino-acid transaminase [Pseudomonadota bacterium]
MSRIAYVNGQYVPHRDAAVHVEDRGYQFADGIYEVCEVLNGRLVDEPLHMARLERSLSELEIALPMPTPALKHIMKETVRRNRVDDGLVYVQVTRGAAPRDHLFPDPSTTKPAVVITAKSSNRQAADAKAEVGVGVITLPDNRWERVDIKSVSLLPNAIAKQKAKEAGAYEAWFVDKDGFVTEGSSTNAWIVDGEGTLITRPAESGILRGITRTVVMRLAEKQGVTIKEEAFSVEDAYRAREAFITAASTIVMPVVSIDDVTIGNGHPGSIARALRAEFHTMAHVA